LVFGGSGQLGEQVLRRWADLDISAPSSKDVDAGDPAQVSRAIEFARADLVVNCSAFNDLPGAEERPADALRINALAVAQMARECASRNIPFATVSTDYVFDGSLSRPYTETDTPGPLSAYGTSKLRGEEMVARLESHAYIVRTCGVYGTRVSSSKGYSFIDRILRLARDGEPIRVVDDQVVSPTYAGDLAVALRSLVQANPAPGVYHAVNEGAVSWYEFAREALRQAGFNAPVTAISTADYPSTVRRPAYSALENAKLHALGIRLPDWHSGIAAYLADRSSV